MIKDIEKFSAALESHRLWQKTIGAKGERLIAEGLDLRDVALLPNDLSECALGSVDLSGMDLSGFDLYAAHLVNCNFQGTDLSNAKLVKTTLDGSNFRDANFNGVDLRRASLIDTDLRGVDLADVIIDDQLRFKYAKLT